MRAWLVVIAACSGAPTVVPAKPIVPTGPELLTSAPGATAFAIDGSDIYWLAPGSGVFELGSGSAIEVISVGSDARGLAVDDHHVYWSTSNELDVLSRGSSAPVAEPIFELSAFAVVNGRVDYVYSESDDRATFLASAQQRVQLDGNDPVIAEGNGPDVGTTTTLYQGSAATPVDGGVHALAVDGDDVVFANTAIFEKVGRGAVNKLGPAGGDVTAIALDAAYIYWAIAAGDHDPAIYRARRAKPELELFTKVGSASQLIVSGAYLYWLDPTEAAIHRIRRQN